MNQEIRYWINYRVVDGDVVTIGEVEVTREKPICEARDVSAVAFSILRALAQAGKVSERAVVHVSTWMRFENPLIVVPHSKFNG